MFKFILLALIGYAFYLNHHKRRKREAEELQVPDENSSKEEVEAYLAGEYSKRIVSDGNRHVKNGMIILLFGIIGGYVGDLMAVEISNGDRRGNLLIPILIVFGFFSGSILAACWIYLFKRSGRTKSHSDED